MLIDLPEREVFAQYTNLLAEQRMVSISLQGVPHEERQAIEAGMQEMISAERVRLAHDRLRAAGVPEDYLVKPGLRNSLEGLPLDERDRHTAEAKIRQLAMRLSEPNLDRYDDIDLNPGHQRPGGPQAETGTVTQSLGDGGCMCAFATSSLPGTEQYWPELDPLPPPAAGSTHVSAVVFLWVNNLWGRTFSGDSLVLRIENGALYGFGPDDIQVGLTTHTTVRWAKEIYAWNACRGRIARVTQGPGSRSPFYITFSRGCSGADTVVFAKPQFAGVWADVGHYRMSRFWSQFGGHRLTFTWITE